MRGYTVEDVQRLSRVPIPDCAGEQAKIFVVPESAESVAFDFGGTVECVDRFLVGLGD
ncbi:hypothetical protein ABZ816_37150 [Actinosynnema sp. NPDC047251]|uniref:Uncharacterized protein n=1 Tax=Saccharothrix espanaensis (strain ATCC 51144 / DSM 44229 / JCM 9112 / NBRC 15066 / NRRL 15764) TaxID=1179773 RepID=K0K2Y6_SACES|nr:hypothetical protein [Saccharothrix espanaensis]CCH32656.1 hypothetical protein BN6_53970 [Saccharothrix espanaensis DSM 44229]